MRGMTMKKQKSEPRNIDRWNPDDLTFLDNRTKDLSFSSPYELERSLERLTESLKRSQTEPGLTPLEFILREFRDEAKKKLEENGLDSEELTEVWRTLFDPEDFSSLHLYLEYNSPSLLEPLETSVQLQNAAHVAFCVDRLRSDISNGDAQQTAIDMLKLCFATVGANLHEIIIRGIRAERGPSLGGKTSQRKRGIDLAIEKIFKGQDAFSIWLYFVKNHYGYEKALEIEGYKIFFKIDIQGLQQDRISKRDAYKRGMLFEIFQDDVKTERGIKLPTFRRYFSETRKKILSK
jgi:hypothetical protein